MLVFRTLSCGCLQEFVVRAHVPAHGSAKYSIAKFPAVRRAPVPLRATLQETSLQL